MDIAIPYDDALSHCVWNALLSLTQTSHLIIKNMQIKNNQTNSDDEEELITQNNKLWMMYNDKNKKTQQPIDIHFDKIEILDLGNIKPYTMMYLILLFSQKKLKHVTIDFNPVLNGESSTCVPKRISESFQFNNLISITTYSNCCYAKFSWLFRNSLKTLKHVHFGDNNNGEIDVESALPWFLSVDFCVIDLLLTSAPELHSLMIDIDMNTVELEHFCKKIDAHKHPKLCEIGIKLCVYEEIEEIPNCNSKTKLIDNKVTIAHYQSILHNIRLLISNFKHLNAWVLRIDFGWNFHFFMKDWCDQNEELEKPDFLFWEFTNEMNLIIRSEIRRMYPSKIIDYDIEFEEYHVVDAPNPLLRIFFNNATTP